MKYAYCIVVLLLLLATTACSVDSLNFPEVKPLNGDVVEIMGRITSFTDYDVNSRGVKQGDEVKITSVALAIFKVNAEGTGLDGDCVYYNSSNNKDELHFTIDRTDDAYKALIDAECAIYVFANIPGMDRFGVGSTLQEMLNQSADVTNLDIPQQGFPMVGSLGDTFSENFDRDDKIFKLSPMNPQTGKLDPPTINGNPQNLLRISMKAMFAKMNFTIAVRPDQTIEGNDAPQFTLTDYEVCDVPKTIDCDNTPDASDVHDRLNGLSVTGNLTASGNNTIKFSFYLPEQLLTPETSAENYEYPFEGKLVKGSAVREEDKVYMQRFKSKLLGEDQEAMNIVISGQYRDHQNHYYDVKYTIYLGKDNYSDFNVERNGEYNNFITIRGILTSDDVSNEDKLISFDHRVNVERSQPAIFSLRREVLLDSHFEVRPLRIRPSGIDGIGNINAVKVEVLNPGATDWMRIEKSSALGEDTGIYITEGVSKGKRKYFTYGLITGNNESNHLQESHTVVVPLTGEGDCVWIYADECLEDGDGFRSGKIQITYGSGTTMDTFRATTDATFPPVIYTISQHKLFPVTYAGSGKKYYIEYEEEYLHNFDIYDDYGYTDYEGMTWGLPNLQLSYEHQAILIHNSGLESLTKNIRKAVLGYSPFYDFYLTRDFNRSTYYFENEAQYTGIVHDHNGFEFCNEIIAEVNSTAHSSDTQNDIKVLTLAQEAKSAIEYCYNKNKRDANGNVVLNGNTGWYLPAIDEIEEIMMSQYTSEGSSYYSYARFEDFQNKYYWSSQPAFYQNIFLVDREFLWSAGDRMGHYMIDNPNYARATKVNFKGGDPNVSTNYEIVSSGMKTGTYYKYLYFVANSGTLNQNISNKKDYVVNELLNGNNTTNTGGSFQTDANGEKYFQFKWDNNDVNETTEKVYAPKYQDGYKHRTNDKARVRCVRKLQ